jgi:hypothetical protein
MRDVKQGLPHGDTYAVINKLAVTRTEKTLPEWPQKGTKKHENADRHIQTCAFRLFVFLRAFRGYLLPSAKFAFSV